MHIFTTYLTDPLGVLRSSITNGQVQFLCVVGLPELDYSHQWSSSGVSERL